MFTTKKPSNTHRILFCCFLLLSLFENEKVILSLWEEEGIEEKVSYIKGYSKNASQQTETKWRLRIQYWWTAKTKIFFQMSGKTIVFSVLLSECCMLYFNVIRGTFYITTLGLFSLFPQNLADSECHAVCTHMQKVYL